MLYLTTRASPNIWENKEEVAGYLRRPCGKSHRSCIWVLEMKFAEFASIQSLLRLEKTQKHLSTLLEKNRMITLINVIFQATLPSPLS